MGGYAKAMKNYATFQGRSSRGEFWQFTVVSFVVIMIALMIDMSLISGPDAQEHIFAGLVVVAHMLPSVAVTVRRLHDTDRSGWWIFINIIPAGSLVLLVFACLPGTPDTNRFGLIPVEAAAGPSARLQKAGTTAQPTPDRRDVVAELERLAQLRAAGALSEPEFEVMKRRLLSTASEA